MSIISYRANVLSQNFPFLAAQHGRTIIVPRQDQAFASRANVLQNPSDEEKDTGIPQAYYMHNVLPNSEGLQSIGFTTQIPALSGALDFQEMYILRDLSENRFLFSPANGKNYVFDGNVGSWVSISLPASFLGNFDDVTFAYINGHTYIFYKNLGMVEYNSTTKVFDLVTLVGVTNSALLGITASNGFLIAWDGFNIYRSSGLDPLNLTPDITTGAGFSIPNDIKGKILLCLPLPSGFIIYTTANAISATFTQNIRFPFQYAEIQGSAGLIPPQQISWQHNGSFHYVWTRGGLQKANKTEATPAFADVTDFLSERIFEDYNETTDAFELTNLTGNLIVRLNLVERRFFVISYGINDFTHALVYDLFFKRWGKIKINHVAAFEFSNPSVYGDITWDGLFTLTWSSLGETSWDDLGTQVLPTEHAKETLAFLQKDGTVQTVTFDFTRITNSGVCVLGRYQYVRDQLLNLNEIELNNVQEGSNFILKILPSIDGSTLLPAITPFLSINTGKFRKYQCSVWGKNHSIVAKGSFWLSDLELSMTSGSRA